MFNFDQIARYALSALGALILTTTVVGAAVVRREAQAGGPQGGGEGQGQGCREGNGEGLPGGITFLGLAGEGAATEAGLHAMVYALEAPPNGARGGRC